MFKRLEIFLIGAVFFLITTIILVVYSTQRVQEFKAHNNDIQKTTLHGAAYAINVKLLDKRRHVRLFANEYSRIFFRLMNFPNDEKTKNDITTRLKQRFHDFFTFTITDQTAKPILENIESFVGHACQLDLANFSKALKTNNQSYNNKVFIHPQTMHYHFDVMAPLYTNQQNPRIFFISFYLNEISDILKTHELPGQKLMLVRASDTSLIEVTSQGARDKIKRDIRLTDEEQRNIKVYEKIADTDWRIVSLPDISYQKKYLRGLWTEAIIILGIVTIALTLLIFIISRKSDNCD